MTTAAKKRGRPEGWTKPNRRERRDYRFVPETLHQIEQGRALAVSKNETEFVEQAIAYYTAALAGNARQTEALLQREPYHASVRHEESKVIRTKPRHQETPPEPSSAPGFTLQKPVYEVYLRHTGACPILPNTTHNDAKDCPKHRIYAEQQPIAQARRKAKEAMGLPDVTHVWITKNGYGTPDTWVKEETAKGGWYRDY